ncbi:MrpF/PhaF family protein [Geomonas sp. RF6]|uniref:MrpF/PhaF family protein n=1 Tax=Geomonas sp. RF6 TaxID=2897342 RepID=UPI001E3B48A4|nr:MrpF/PhaF family protein [Geomonas sp. RF6]UFS72129.1 MrpF/PhaF family protein [Geomonas sp. RF6]
MNPWLLTAAVLLLAILPCGWVCLRGRLMERFAALQMAQLLSVIVLILLAEGYGRENYFDLAIILAILSFASALVYIRFLERWL